MDFAQTWMTSPGAMSTAANRPRPWMGDFLAAIFALAGGMGDFYQKGRGDSL